MAIDQYLRFLAAAEISGNEIDQMFYILGDTVKEVEEEFA